MIIINYLSLTPFSIRQLASSLMLCSLAACSPQTPEEQIASYNKKLGPEGELTKTHLVVRWTKGAGPPVTFKVPREYLDDPPLRRDDDGSLRWLYVRFAIPGVVPVKLLPLPLKVDPPEKIEAFNKYQRSRVRVDIDRDSPEGLFRRESYRRGQQYAKNYQRDGEISGLERYTQMRCYTVEELQLELPRQFLAGKEADDPTLSNCRLNRHEFRLVSPPEVVADNEGVAMECSTLSCSAYFLAGRRGARIGLMVDDLSSWREKVESARQLVDSFVVP